MRRLRISAATGATFFVLGLLGLQGCGDDVPASVDAAIDQGPDALSNPDLDCTPITSLGPVHFTYNAAFQLTGVRAQVQGDLGADAPLALVVELYDENTGDVPPLTPGTFDLATDPNDNLATCQHCVMVTLDAGPVPAVAPTVRYFQTRGQLELTTVADPLGDQFAGQVRGLTLREVTVDASGRSSLVAGGRCARLDLLAFDTTAAPAGACQTVLDCANELNQVCAPQTATCTGLQCFDGGGCADDEVCISQFLERLDGACYQRCNPRADACGAGAICAQRGIDPTVGVCKRVDAGAAGAACAPGTQGPGTGCGPDLICSDDTAACRARCDFFAADPGCPADQRCSLFGRCEPPSLAEPAQVGERCSPDAVLATPCAADAEALRGLCFAFADERTTCQRACLDDTHCAAAEFCALRFDSGLGLCRPDPVCGDGVRGEVGEACDDGNRVDADGCSNDCQRVDVGYLCADARLPVLPLGTTVAGDTSTGVDGLTASCQFDLARSQAWKLTVPGPGRLTVRVDSPGRHTVSLRTTCADVGSELVCDPGSDQPSAPTVVEQQFVGPGPRQLVVLVGALSILEEAGFALTATFVPERCGDAIIAGAEVCDDGNTRDGDGCRGDCRLVEHAAYCADAPSLTTLMPMVGSTVGAPALYQGSCHFGGSGGDRLYRYVAPRAGTLHLELVQGTGDLVLTVYGPCGAPPLFELACSAVYDVERVDVPVLAGQELTVAIDSLRPDQPGPYVLTARLD